MRCRAGRKNEGSPRKKKLTEAGRQSVRHAGKDATAEDEEWIILPDAAKARDDDAAFELYPENHPAWLVYESCSTQWRIGLNGHTGLDYIALESTLRLMAVPRKKHPDIFWRVRCIEAGVLERLAELREQR